MPEPQKYVCANVCLQTWRQSLWRELCFACELCLERFLQTWRQSLRCEFRQSAPIGDRPPKWLENAFCSVEIALNLRSIFYKNLSSKPRWPGKPQKSRVQTESFGTNVFLPVSFGSKPKTAVPFFLSQKKPRTSRREQKIIVEVGLKQTSAVGFSSNT